MDLIVFSRCPFTLLAMPGISGQGRFAATLAGGRLPVSSVCWWKIEVDGTTLAWKGDGSSLDGFRSRYKQNPNCIHGLSPS